MLLPSVTVRLGGAFFVQCRQLCLCPCRSCLVRGSCAAMDSDDVMDSDVRFELVLADLRGKLFK